MSVELDVRDLPEEVVSVEIKEQKVFDGLTFPLILSPEDSFEDKNAEFWNEWVEKNLNVLENLLFKYGAILFRGFPFDTPKDFDEFAKSYGYDPFFNVGGGALRLKVVGNVYTASETAPEITLALHHEMAHINENPCVLFFYCDIPAREGGNTPLAPSNIVYRKMAERDPDLVRRLEKEGLCYSRLAPDENDERRSYVRSWQSTCFTSNREEAEKYAKANGFDFEWQEDGWMKLITLPLPAIRFDKRTGKKMWFNSLFPFSILSQNKKDLNKLEVHFPNGETLTNDEFETLRQVMDEVKVSLKWQHKDVIMVDNRTTMHSKESYPSPPRRVLVSYFKDHHGPL